MPTSKLISTSKVPLKGYNATRYVSKGSAKKPTKTGFKTTFKAGTDNPAKLYKGKSMKSGKQLLSSAMKSVATKK